MGTVRIDNAGQEIIGFEPPVGWNKSDKFLVSFNAGACRILLPRNLESWIEEMQTAEIVHIERSSNKLFIMFDDGTETPFCIQTNLGAVVDFVPWAKDSGRIDLVSTVWTFRRGRPHCSLRRKATYEYKK